MADYRCIYRNAGTGERTSSLSHLEFRVWVQYQLSADDFGVCPALAEKLQGDNDALYAEPQRRVQAAIERLVAVNLCQVFADGRRRYLYQWDWQDWQRLKHATATSLPPIPSALLEKCSPKTRALFAQFHPKIREGLPLHAGACDAPATADAAAHQSEGGPGETEPPVVEMGPPAVPRGRPGLVASPGRWGVQHAGHTDGLCGWKCMFPDQRAEFATGAGWDEAAVTAWAQGVRDEFLAAGRPPTGKPYDFWNARWEERHGSSQAPRATSVAQLDPLAGVRGALNRG